MLRVSKLADYSTVVMVYLAGQQPKLLNAREIANPIHLPVPTVAKLLKLLSQAGLLTSQRGAKGGYALARATQDISVAEIIQAVEGDTGLTECSIADGECHIEDVCSIRGNWRLINKVVYDALGSVSLQELAMPSMPIAAVAVGDIKRQQEA